MSSARRILVGSLGMPAGDSTAYDYWLQEATDILGPQKATTTIFGLYQLLRAKGETPDLILLPVTGKVWEKRRLHIEEERVACGLSKEQVIVEEVPFTVEDPLALFQKVGNHIRQGDTVVLDVTQGLRHHAFLFYGLALYLRSLREAHIENVYYAQTQDRQSTFVSLKPVLDLTEWIHAITVFKENGFTRPLARLIEPLAGQGNTIVQGLRDFSFAYESGLPLELGKASFFIKERLQKALEPEDPPKRSNEWVKKVPLGEELFTYIQDTADQYAFQNVTARQLEGGWKARFSLTEDELSRQLKLIEDYERRDQVAVALGLSREWLVSYHIWAEEGFQEAADWLPKDRRQQTENRLGHWLQNASAIHGKAFPDDPFLQAYRRASQWRNHFMHQGMQDDVVTPRDPLAGELKTLLDKKVIPLSAGAILLTGLGFTKGVLFSALKRLEEQFGSRFIRAVVITSYEAEPGMWEAVDAAGFDRAKVIPILLKDPLYGVEEEEEAVRKALRALLPAAEVWVNLTGGTSWMSILLMRIVAELSPFVSSAASHGKREPGPISLVRRFILVDRRDRREQEENPWEVAELVQLGGRAPVSGL